MQVLSATIGAGQTFAAEEAKMSERGKRHQSDTMPTLSRPGDCRLTRKIGISSSIFHGGNLRERIGYSGDGGAESLHVTVR